MRLEYSLTRFDLFRTGARALLRNRIFWCMAIPLLTITWWSSFNYPETRGQSLTARAIGATGSAVACALVGLLGGSAFIALQSLLRKDRGVLGKHTLDITEGGLLEATDVNSSLHKWGTTFRIRETTNCAYIYVSDTNVHIVPKTRCSSESSVEEFLIELRTRIRMFQPGAAPNGGPATPVGSLNAPGGPPSVS
jgi:hypothetical protein